MLFVCVQLFVCQGSYNASLCSVRSEVVELA